MTAGRSKSIQWVRAASARATRAKDGACKTCRASIGAPAGDGAQNGASMNQATCSPMDLSPAHSPSLAVLLERKDGRGRSVILPFSYSAGSSPRIGLSLGRMMALAPERSAPPPPLPPPPSHQPAPASSVFPLPLFTFWHPTLRRKLAASNNPRSHQIQDGPKYPVLLHSVFGFFSFLVRFLTHFLYRVLLPRLLVPPFVYCIYRIKVGN
ncbi:hypothetical protein B0T24DRAFT_115737 [Lasiosphaeria ovina]|uniref:Uncharacterized protein n=1 Tax=Lasiosphaeria ovina TaxID=92902 RepID=A0AAE0MYN4_9PEZI|nr:hypothetical protein B0T24DRAFT_115737 [Lasiosphaeria ovina]